MRRPRMQMPKKALYDVERHASIDKEARKRVAQVVQAGSGRTAAGEYDPQGKYNDAGGRPKLRMGKYKDCRQYAEPPSKAIADRLSAMTRARPNFDFGTSSVLFFQST